MNIVVNKKVHCQTKEFAVFLRGYVETSVIDMLKNNSIYNERYNNNNDVFIHLRLGDIAEWGWNESFSYYEKVLSQIEYDNVFVSSDTIDHEIVQKLVNKYNAKRFIMDEINTILFGSTNKHIILSSGTFSFLIGLFALPESDVFIPSNPKFSTNMILPHWRKM